MLEKIKLTLLLSLVAIVNGAVVGVAVSLFALALFWCNQTRSNIEWLIYFLPYAGLVIVGIRKLTKVDKPTGTNRVIARIHEKTYVKILMAPLIFVSTLISQLFGASVGREAAALQIGGSLGSYIGKSLKIDEQHSPIVIESGMAASFSALFGTPVASALFALEIANCRIKNWVAIVPCFVSSWIAFFIGKLLNVPYLNVEIDVVMPLNQQSVTYIIGLAVLCAVASVIFVTAGKLARLGLSKIFKNQFIRIFLTGTIILLLTLSLGDQTYNGVGSDTIHECLTNPNTKIVWWAFLMKILFTSVSLGGGYQGGEIVPALFIGASLGNTFSQCFPLDPCFASATGMIGLFAACTKCPLASFAIAFELFGLANPVPFVITVVVSTLCSGTFRIYEEQKLPFSYGSKRLAKKQADKLDEHGNK